MKIKIEDFTAMGPDNIELWMTQYERTRVYYQDRARDPFRECVLYADMLDKAIETGGLLNVSTTVIYKINEKQMKWLKSMQRLIKKKKLDYKITITV